MLLEINPYNIDARSIELIVEALKKGELVIFPTDSVYNIGCDLMNKKALEKLAKFKGLKLSKARFSIICSNLSEISNYIKPIDRSTFKVLKHHLPGPFTFILNATNEIQKIFDSNRKEIGIRIPNSLLLQKMIAKLGNPIATSSIHDEDDEIMDYITDPFEIYQRYDHQVELIIDGGIGNLYASTVVDCTENEPIIIRQGIGILEL